MSVFAEKLKFIRDVSQTTYVIFDLKFKILDGPTQALPKAGTGGSKI
jgi:hypothetical protein